jgi:hypothetical protein
VGLERVAALAWAAELAFRTGDAAGAAALVRRAIELLDMDAEPVRLALLHERLGTYLFPAGDREGGLAAFRRAADLGRVSEVWVSREMLGVWDEGTSPTSSGPGLRRCSPRARRPAGRPPGANAS